MSGFARKIVSGGKARFKDKELNVDLDLVYLTDRIIIMGYPASGVAALYRNSRHDARRFIEHRHADKYWVFNFCPLTENTYDPSFFRGHVSRYPFPDHHAPPLALLALAVREMHAWLSADPERVIVVHCKAGKGRSGTLACAYLLTLETPAGPTLQRSLNAKEWTGRRAEELLRQAEEELTDEEDVEVGGEAGSLREVGKGEVPDLPVPVEDGEEVESSRRTDTPGSMGSADVLPLAAPTAAGSGEPVPRSSSPSLESVLELHTQRRMRAKKPRPTTSEGKPVKKKYGVSISSQRRFLQYWALLISGTFPPRFWTLPPVPQQNVLLKSITVRMKPAPRAGRTAVSLLSAALSRFSSQRPAGEVWASISRYDPRFEEMLEGKERETRDGERGVGRSKFGGSLREELEEGEWDKRKMIRSFARVGSASAVNEVGNNILTYNLQPISPEQWLKVNKAGRQSTESRPPEEQLASSEPAVEGTPTDATPEAADDESYEVASMQSTLSSQPGVYSHRSILMDECRAVRVKLFHGQVPMGWFWFIPAFEMMHASDGVCRYKLQRSELDFALGPGAWIIDVETEMQWA
ncbi:hypothetical protein CALVIDRAFT_511880, partial [Calocera viscosa TUFC12733]